MNQNKLNETQGICVIILFILSAGFIMPLGIPAEEDIWISVFMGMAISIILVKIYTSIINSYENKSFFEIINITFGPIIGNTLNLLFVWYGLHICAFTLRDFGEFPASTTLDDTPLVVIMAVILLMCIWIVKKGQYTIGKSANIIVLLTSPIPIFTILILSPKMDILNIMPILHCGVDNFIKSTFATSVFPFGETMLAITLLEELKNKKNAYKIYVKGILVSGITLVGVTLTEILIIGNKIYANTYFPVYVVASQANLGEFLQRIEIVTLLATGAAGIIKMAVCLFFMSKGLATIFRIKKYNFLVSALGLLSFSLSFLVYSTVINFGRWTYSIYPYYAAVFQIIIPIIILSVIKLKKNRYN